MKTEKLPNMTPRAAAFFFAAITAADDEDDDDDRGCCASDDDAAAVFDVTPHIFRGKDVLTLRQATSERVRQLSLIGLGQSD
jgi:hypothetical protein